LFFCCEYSQVPDITSNGEEQIDAVVLDEDTVGAPDGNGEGAKILRGEGALDFYLGNPKRPSKVRTVAGFDGRRASMIVSLKMNNIAFWDLQPFDLNLIPDVAVQCEICFPCYRSSDVMSTVGEVRIK